MSVFTPVELEWLDKVYTVKPHKVMGLIATIEEVITLAELQGYVERKAPPLAKLCMAYASALRYAGATVSADEVYETAFSGETAQLRIINATMGLMQIMLPPSARARLQAVAEVDETAGVPDAGNPPAADANKAASLKKRSSSRAGREKEAVSD